MLGSYNSKKAFKKYLLSGLGFIPPLQTYYSHGYIFYRGCQLSFTGIDNDILAISSGIFSSILKREEFERGLKKPEEFEETSNKSPKKQGRISTGWGGTIFLAGQNKYP